MISFQQWIQENKWTFYESIKTKTEDFQEFVWQIKKSIKVPEKLFDQRLERAKQLELPGIPTKHQSKLKTAILTQHVFKFQERMKSNEYQNFELEMMKVYEQKKTENFEQKVMKVYKQKIQEDRSLNYDSFSSFRGGGGMSQPILRIDSLFALKSLSQYPSIKKIQKTQGILRSMGVPGFSFCDLEKPIFRSFTEAPPWRTISPGLNLEGVCPKEGCKAYDNRVWIPKEYGTFYMNQQAKISKCPICKTKAIKVRNMGIYMARVIITGEYGLLNQSQNPTSQEYQKTIISDDRTGIKTFQLDQNQPIETKWYYLKVKCQPLKNNNNYIPDKKNK